MVNEIGDRLALVPVLRMDNAWRTSLVEKLHTASAIVIFEKLNGERRTMRCTLMPEFLPESTSQVGEGKEKSKEAAAVFDLDKNEWRSFRFDKLIDVTFNL
jgi:hypothetical protein